MTTEYEPLLLLLELPVLQRMSSFVFKVLDSLLLCHDRPTTSLLKEGMRLYQLTPSTAPGLAFLDPQQEVLLGLDNCKINTAPHPSQGTAASWWSASSLRWHSAPHTCSHPPAQWSTHLCHQRDSLSLQLCGVDFTCPAAHCPQGPSVQHSL